MPGQFYDNAERRTYQFLAANISAASVLGRFQGPAGKVGRISGFEYHLTVATTVAPANVDLDTVAGLTTPFTAAIEVAAINTGGAATKAELEAGDELPADTIVQLSSDGGSTAGTADLYVTVEWY